MKTIMKKMKKIVAVLIALVMVLGMSTMAFGEDEPTTGSITIKNATKGHTYTAYKVFDATYNGDAVSYKTASTNASKLSNTLFGWSAADSDDNISVWVKDGVAESDVIDWVKANYSQFGGTAITGSFDDTNSTVTFSGLDFGYYYITSSLGTAVTIDTAAPTAEVYDKNFKEPTDPVKTIIAVDGKAQDKVTAANAHVGSVVKFQVDAKTVNWTGAKTATGSKETVTETQITTEWTLTDKPTNMTIDPESIKVKVNGAEITNFTAAGTSDGGMNLTIPMVDANGNSIYAAPADGLIPIEVTYDATIDAAAASAPAKNEIPGDNPPPPVVICTHAFQVVKTDDNEQPLPGAQFELWSNKGDSSADAAALTFIDNGDGTYTYSPTGTVTTLDMTTNTTIVVKGLDTSWNYTLKEITVPNGYNQAPDADIEGSSLTKVSETVITEDGEETTTIVDTTINSTELYQEIVVNEPGIALPTTGGIGTTIFYVLGSMLVIGCGIVLISRRRMQNNK